MKKKAPVYVANLGLGVLCVAAAYAILWKGARPELFLELAPSQTEERIAIRFTNIGKRAIKLDLSDLNGFLYIPETRNRICFVQIRAGETAGKQMSPKKAYTVLRPKEHVEVGNAYPLLAALSPGKMVVGGIYTASSRARQRDVWNGVLRSVALILDVQ